MTLNEITDKQSTLEEKLKIVVEWLKVDTICSAQIDLIASFFENMILVGENEICFHKHLIEIREKMNDISRQA